MTHIGSTFREFVKISTPLLIIAVAVGGFMVLGRRKVPARQSRSNDMPLVETSVVKRFDDPIVLDADGVAMPLRRVTLSAEVDGRITQKSRQARGGRVVKPKTPLFEIDRTDHELAVKRLDVQLRQQDEQLAAVDVEIANARSLISIADNLWKVDQRTLARAEGLRARRVISEGQLDEARTTELTAHNNVQTLKNRLAEHEQKKKTTQAGRDLVAVQLEQAEKDLERTQVASPITGTVVTAHVEINDFVRRGDPLIEISDSTQMEVRCSLRIGQLYWILLSSGRLTDSAQTQDMPVDETLQLEWLQEQLELPPVPVKLLYEFAGATISWEGVLWRYEGTGLDQQTRTVPCRILVEKPAKPVIHGGPPDAEQRRTPPRLLTGMYVAIEIPINPPIELLRIPIAALRAGGHVWIVREGHLHIEKVEVARSEDNFVIIRRKDKAVKPGDRVVTSPLSAVQNKMPVREAGKKRGPKTRATPKKAARS